MADHIIHEHGEDSSSTALVAVVIVLLILVVGWFAYNAGVFGGRDTTPDTIDVNVGGTETPGGTTGGAGGNTGGGSTDGGGTAY
jgi:hypothetical protein